MGSRRIRIVALLIALIGLALNVYVEYALTKTEAPDRFGWFIYESVAWLALLGVGPLLPASISVFVAAALALAVEVVAYWLVFVEPNSVEHAAIYFWKPLLQLAAIAATWLAGYLVYLRAQRASVDG